MCRSINSLTEACASLLVDGQILGAEEANKSNPRLGVGGGIEKLNSRVIWNDTKMYICIID